MSKPFSVTSGSNLRCRGWRQEGLLRLLENVLALAQAGIVTGASERNWASYGDHVLFAEHIGMPMRQLLCDPQTSGGLLVSCAPDTAAAVLDVFNRYGCNRAAQIGTMVEGSATIEVRK